jgi:mono/diheme cytochrome c family protein
MLRALSAVLFLTIAAQAATVWDGAYTDAQADRGKATFERKCAQCHGPDLRQIAAQGFALRGPEFVDLWREDNLDVLVGFVRANMPKAGETPLPGTGPLSLDDAGKLDAIAYILKSNDFPAGSSELTLASAATTLLVQKDGPKPLPNLTNVMVAGCLTVSANDVWSITKATSPKRTMDPLQITPAEVKAMAAVTPGTGGLRVNNLDALTTFNADKAKGQRVAVKGILYTSNPRVNATAAELLGPCAP